MALLTINRPPRSYAPVRPGLRYGPSPRRKRSSVPRTGLDRAIITLRSRLSRLSISDKDKWLAEMREHIKALETLGSIQFSVKLERMKNSVVGKGYALSSLHAMLAHVVIVARNTLGLTPYDVQLLATRELLHGRFVEMSTGEGKTLCVALAAAVSALDGTPVHVLTSSDYLAERDATYLADFYEAMGLTSSFVLPQMSDAERQLAYRSDVVHVTGKQVAFDWLRDHVTNRSSPHSLATRLTLLINKNKLTDTGNHQKLLRGLCLAIIDEADSLLIDESTTPLVLAAPSNRSMLKRDKLIVALALARLLQNEVDFTVSTDRRTVTLTSNGEIALENLASRFNCLWRATRYRNEKVREALIVLNCWHRDRDYVVRNKRIELVDPHTGRAMPDRRLPHGLHALLELKEQCDITPDNEVVASLPFQHFFQNYIRLAGMSGTLREVRGELARVYGVKVVCAPLNRPLKRVRLPTRIFSSSSDQLNALVKEVECYVRRGQPVLIGTRSVEQSNLVSAVLDSNDFSHRLLNASQDSDEAEIVAKAGIAGNVTVATNMAGRGTDIKLGPGVRECGGMHVVALAFNDSRRLDRQLAGRAGRQGDPGSCVQLISLDDESLTSACPEWLLRAIKRLLSHQLAKTTRSRVSTTSDQLVDSSQIDQNNHANGIHAMLNGTRVATLILLALVSCTQRAIEQCQAKERQRALVSSKTVADRIAIGAGKDFTR